MLRRYQRFFVSLQMLRDGFVVGLSFVAAFWLRFSLAERLLPSGPPSADETASVGVLLVVLWPAVGRWLGLYRSQREKTLTGELIEVVRATLAALFVAVTVTYFVRSVRYSRAILLTWVVLNSVAVGLARALCKGGLRALRARGYNLRHVIVIGTGELAEHVLSVVVHERSLGLRLLGVVAHTRDDVAAMAADGAVARAPLLGTLAELPGILEQSAVDQVLIALPIEAMSALKSIMQTLSRETVDVRLIPDLYQYMTLCGSMEEFRGMPIINLQSSPLWGWGLVCKRTFDVLAAAGALLVLSPVLLAVAAAIRLGEPGPVLYRQERVGLDGRRFMMLKFRTMRLDAERAGAQMAQALDSRCTPLGRLLRRLSLDELPQLVNVVRGQMSLVGPRPERPCFIEGFKKSVPRYALRHKIKAGMTGWAQINGLRGNTSIAKRIELDLYYIENWSLLLDLKILMRTVMGGFLSPHAY